jgi:peptide/nickel transport system substrate-binding protein
MPAPDPRPRVPAPEAAGRRPTRRALLAAALPLAAALAACASPPAPTPGAGSASPLPSPTPGGPPAPVPRSAALDPGQADPSLIRPPSPTPTPPPTATTIPATATAAALAGRPAPAAAAAAAGATPTITRPAQFTWALEADPVSLDAHQQTNHSSTLAYEHVYESLTAFDERLEVVPSLATGWEVGADGLSYTFRLDQAARFHDGASLTADDVRWSFARVLAPENRSPWATSWYEPLREAVAVDRATVRVDLKRPYPQLPAVLASLRGAVVYPKDVDRRGLLTTGAIGTGPFKLKEYLPNDRIVYERNRDYRGRDVPKIDGMVARILPDEEDRIAGLRSGALDYATLSPEGVRRLGSGGGHQVVAGPRAWLATLELPYNTHPAFKDWRVRRAFSLAIDREEIIRKSLLGAGVLSGNVPSGFADWALPEAEVRQLLRRDVGQARQLLAEAGFPEGKNFPEVRLLASPEYPEFVSNALAVQAQLREAGLNLEVERVDWGSYIALVNRGTTQLGFSASTFYPDPDLYLWPQGHSRSLHGVRGYRHRQQDELDRTLDAARVWTGPREERRELFRKADRMMLEDPPWLTLYVAANIEVLSPRVKGYVGSFTGRRPGFRSLSLA